MAAVDWVVIVFLGLCSLMIIGGVWLMWYEAREARDDPRLKRRA